MNIYTYYEDVNFAKQPELIDVWKQSWEIGGFNPIVLSRDDAKKSPLYEEYYSFVQRVHKKSVGKTLLEGSYWLAAQLEIVAFSNIEEPSFFCDYDMINNGYEKFLPENKIHWRNRACSCFITGGKTGWLDYIEFLFENEDTIASWCYDWYKKTGRDVFGDQDFLIAIYDKGIKSDVFEGSRNLDIIGARYIPDSENICKAIHVSHDNVSKIKKSHPKWINMKDDDIRLFCAKEILNNLINSQ